MPARLLVVSCYFPGDSLVEATVATYAAHADLVLVPIEAGVPLPAAAAPFHPARTVGVPLEALLPVKKWRAIGEVLRRVDLDRYDYVLFPDDDLSYPERFVERYLAVVDAHDLALSQPALTAASYHSHGIVLEDPAALLRRTNFVEIMTPCFRRDALAALAPTLDGATSPMGYGMDLHWPYACEAAGLRMGIVDAVPVGHEFRPVGTHYRGDDLHGQGYEYGRRFPRILLHEIAVRERVPRGAAP